MAGERDVAGQTELVDELLEFIKIGAFTRMRVAHDDPVDLRICLAERSDELQKIFVPFESGDAPGEDEELFAGELRKILLPAGAPRDVRLETTEGLNRINPVAHQADGVGRRARKIIRHVIANAFGDGHDAFTARHDGRVGIHGIKAMNGADQARAGLGIGLPPREPGDPARHARVEVQDIGAFLLQDAPERVDLKQ
mgnify:CR=1 FL=1